jgi:multidrug efflux pump subunit AcrA (membrane-fusion protein)
VSGTGQCPGCGNPLEFRVATSLVAVCPYCQQVVARGIVWPPEQAQLRAGAAGFVERLELEQGATAAAGQQLVLLQDPVLVAAQERIAAERGGLLAQQYGALLTQPVRAAELAEDLGRNAAELARVEEQLAQLEVRAHLPGEVRDSSVPFTENHVARTLEDVERVHIERTLRVHNANRTHAARELGISRATLIKKIKEYGLSPRGR